MIKRYRHWLGEEARHMVETFDGEYVLYTDHIAETRKLIDTYDLLISQEDKKIAELEAENAKLRELVDGAKEIVEIANCTSRRNVNGKLSGCRRRVKP